MVSSFLSIIERVKSLGRNTKLENSLSRTIPILWPLNRGLTLTLKPKPKSLDLKRDS